MKKIALLGLLAGIVPAAFADPNCVTIPPTQSNITNLNPGCVQGGIDFTNFLITIIQAPVPNIAVTSLASFPGGDTQFVINPNLGEQFNADEKKLTFTVNALDGFINGWSLTGGGSTNSTIREVLCAGTVDLTGACVGTTVLDTTQTGNFNTGIVPLAPTFGTLSVFQDFKTPIGAALTGAGFDFQVSPEPGMLVLLGSGLCGLALLRRRARL
jgi:hypothetical protein